MWNSFKNWYTGQDIIHAYRRYKISADEASAIIVARQAFVIGIITVTVGTLLIKGIS